MRCGNGLDSIKYHTAPSDQLFNHTRGAGRSFYILPLEGEMGVMKLTGLLTKWAGSRWVVARVPQ